MYRCGVKIHTEYGIHTKMMKKGKKPVLRNAFSFKAFCFKLLGQTPASWGGEEIRRKKKRRLKFLKLRFGLIG